METYLYVYRNDQLRSVYIGIGASPARIWQHHNPRAEALLDHEATTVFVTSAPFPDRPSAERAESAAICAAAASGVEVLSDHEDLAALTNIAKVHSSKHLKLAVYKREGTVRYEELQRTALVTLSMDSIGREEATRRPSLHGGRTAEVFHFRATRWWGLGEAEKRRDKKRREDGTLPRDVVRLIAVQKSTFTILGAWTLTDQQWCQDNGSWMFLTDEELPNLRGQQFDWCRAQPSNAVTWSRDIRAELRGSAN